jgi:hypothetical protein
MLFVHSHNFLLIYLYICINRYMNFRLLLDCVWGHSGNLCKCGHCFLSLTVKENEKLKVSSANSKLLGRRDSNLV